MRLDVYLVREGYFGSRQRAQDAIGAGLVKVDGRIADKPSRHVTPGSGVIAADDPVGYVSRGGLKLEKALDAFQIHVDGMTMLDVGASTGGFTECLLSRGARRIYAVDVGHGQLAPVLAADPRVISMEGTDIRGAVLPETVDGAAVDVSFIPLKLVLPSVIGLLKEKGFIIALVKPQFEAGRAGLGKSGVVKDPAVHKRVLREVIDFCRENGMGVKGLIPSPICGRAGNREYLMYIRNDENTGSYDIDDVVARSFDKE